ncbi:MAG TPA: IS21 family transposase [Eubacteriaceae bacterium]|nr:IS21 family transposase [Eubacteriaceae bacterium]
MYFNKGLSVAEIQKRTTHARNTITKYLNQEDFNPPTYNRLKEKKSDLVRPFVREILLQDKNKRKKQRHTAKRIFERACREIPDLCQIGERTMRNIVKEEKALIYTDNDCFLDLQHPGGEAQVDFGEIDIYQDGNLITAHEFVMTFPASNAGYCQVTLSETMEAVCQSLEKIFEHNGKVPKRIWFDQMAAAALRQKDSKGNVVANPRFQRFALHHGFEIVFCNPDSGNEKGSVENKVGYFRNNLFIPEPIIDDLDKYNEDLLKRCDADNNRQHYKLKPLTQNAIFDKEKDLMHELNPIVFDYAKEGKYRVYKNGHIKVDSNEYSVSPSHVGEYVLVKFYANELIVYNHQYHEITRHQRSFDKGRKITHWVDFLTLVAKRPRAIKYVEFYNLLPKEWKEYTSLLAKDELRDALYFLKHCLTYKDFAFATKVVEKNMKEQVTEPEALWTTYYRMNENQSLYLPDIMDCLPEIPGYTFKIENYDDLIGGDRQ